MITESSEKRFEQDIESCLISQGEYTAVTESYDKENALFPETFIGFIKETQPKEWERFVISNKINPEKKLINAFSNACETSGLLKVLREGFKHRGQTFRVCYFKPESRLNASVYDLYKKNILQYKRQWYYSEENKNSVDLVFVLNGIPIIAAELKNQFKNQNIDNSKRQWMYDRDPREPCFKFNQRILAYFGIDLTDICMTTRLDKGNTYFIPFNQGSNGPGVDGGKGNPENPDGYPTAYFWEEILKKDSILDILQKFIHLQKKDGKETLIFPRYHQLHAVRTLIADIAENGSGKNYLIQHSAGSGKSNTIAWTAYRLASLHTKEDVPLFESVIVVTDRTVLDAQLQETISSFDHKKGVIATIGDKQTSKDLRDAVNAGVRIIVTTLQKFPVIYTEIEDVRKKNFAIIIDEAHSSQTGQSALKLKAALADTEEALAEYARLEGKEEEELDPHDNLLKEILVHGQHKNLTYLAFTATPKDTTLELFGEEREDGSHHPFHVYSMRQAIEEGFILDVLQNYMTYDTCFKIVKTISDNPELPASRSAKIIRKFQTLHPYNISQKTQIIIETFRDVTSRKINGKGKMMVVTSSRLAAVRYYHEAKRYLKKKNYDNIDILVAFSGSIEDGGETYTESSLNVRKDGSHISEAQTKAEFKENFNVLIVAEKYQTGFDEPLLHTMIIDKKLKGVKAVQTLSRLNRTHPEKTDTFILDFINTKEEILDAFQPFYQETYLSEEVNIDLIYQTQAELREYGIYNDDDIELFTKEYFSRKGQDAKALGRLASILKPVTDRYNTLKTDSRYQFRRLLRSFIKWYGYIAQVLRTYDTSLHKEYVFASYLLHFIPNEPVEMIDLENKLKLEYYRLQKTFEGELRLSNEDGVYDPVTKKGGAGKDTKEPLDEIIERINERYKGEFTDADRVMLTTLRDKLVKNEKLVKSAKTTDQQVFVSSVFPQAFAKTAQESYLEAQETYESLFKDKNKYETIMHVLAEMLFREMRK